MHSAISAKSTTVTPTCAQLAMRSGSPNPSPNSLKRSLVLRSGDVHLDVIEPMSLSSAAPILTNSLSQVVLAFGRHLGSSGSSCTQSKTASTHFLRLPCFLLTKVLAACVKPFSHLVAAFAARPSSPGRGVGVATWAWAAGKIAPIKTTVTTRARSILDLPRKRRGTVDSRPRIRGPVRHGRIRVRVNESVLSECHRVPSAVRHVGAAILPRKGLVRTQRTSCHIQMMRSIT